MNSWNFSESLKIEFQKKLLVWYSENNRNFPWRESKNFYNIIIAEIMLQKTNAAKVEKVYPNFIKKYPDFYALNKASSNNLREEFNYLGLQNQKAPILKELAKKVIIESRHEFFHNKNDLLQIKGIGEYIANAVMCFAFDKRVPIVDGNIIRILERVFNIKSSKKNARSDIKIWKNMEKLLPVDNFKDFNYALLDFAALICTFYNPRCDECFLPKDCFYFNKLLIKN